MTIDQAKVDRALALIEKGASNSDYFFEQLRSPEWIQPLARAGLFTSPYDAIYRGDSVIFPFWVPGQYLARMASIPSAQFFVVEVLKALPASDNPRVYEVIADAAAALPAELAKKLVKQLLLGVRLPFQVLLPEKVGSVIVRLSDGGQVRAAISLARTLFAIIPSSPREAGDEGDSISKWLHRKAKGRIDDWHYAKALDQVLTSFIRAAELKGLRMLCCLLREAVVAERVETDESTDDYSYIWRPTIAHSKERYEDVTDALVTAVRDGAIQLLDAAPNRLRTIVEELRRHPGDIYYRLVLFLLYHHGEADIALVRDYLKDPQTWEVVGLHPEYELLLQRHFGRLTPEVQEAYLAWVESGPDRARYVDFRKRMDGQTPPIREVEHHCAVWMRDHLGMLRPYLTGRRKERLAHLEEIGPAQEAGIPHHRVTVGWRGEKSPLSEEETLSLGWPSLVAKVRDWAPPSLEDFDAPSAEGLANSLRQRVAANPQDAIQHLHEVVGVAPRYIAATLEPLREAIRQKQVSEWDWDSLITFLEHAVEEARTAKTDLDQWQWVSRSAASLLDDSLDAGSASIPIRFRKRVWSILERLSDHPDPTPEHEAQYGGSNMDPATLSLNTVRGKAFHGIIGYTLWWRRHLEALPTAAERLASGLDELPEVRKVLDQHLDLDVDPSLAVRAVYGQWFPWLVLIDESWAAAHAYAIFTDNPNQTELYWAAWGTYVAFCRPYSSVREILRPVYSRAIADLREGMAIKVAAGERPSEHLAEHLMAYYWRGELSLQDELISGFFQSAESKLRGHALDWIGRTLMQPEASLTADAHQRLRALWEWRMTQDLLEADEVRAFGWWFASGQMDPAWSLKHLKALLDASVLPDPDHLVVERLANVASSDPREALWCVEQMIELAREGWAIHGWRDEMKAILETGLRSANTDVNEQAKRIVHRLGALGFRDFRALLKPGAVPGESPQG